MPDSKVIQTSAAYLGAPAISRPLFQGPLYVAIIFLAVIGLFWSTAYEMVGPELAHGDYTHRIFIAPAFLIMAWSQREQLARLPLLPFWWGLVGVAAAGLLWFAGNVLFVRVITDFAMVLMVPLTVVTVLGYRWFAPLVFPFSMLLFVIPFERPLVPLLVKWTAAVSVGAVELSGVPALREGAYFTLPTGAWSVADTCSGSAFFTTSIMLGMLYAWSMYNGWRKRAIFIAGAFVIGIVGNWIRVYLTVMIAHLSDNRYLRDDHYMFGWYLYAVFLFLYCWLGWRYRDDLENAQDRTRTAPSQATGLRLAGAAIAALLLLAIWPLGAMGLTAHQKASDANIADVQPASGWSSTARDNGWKPSLTNASRERVQSFEKDGRYVDVFYGVFPVQTWTSKLVTSVNQFIDVGNSPFSLADRGSATTALSGQPLQVKSGLLRGQGSGVLAWQWYWVGNTATGSDIEAKLRQLRLRLNGDNESSVWVAVSTPADSRDAAAKTLQEFMRDMGGSLQRSLAQTTGD